MKGADLISTRVFPLKKNDTVGNALMLMHDWEVSSLPVVDGGMISGFCRESDLEDLNHDDKVIHHLNHDIKQIAESSTHLFDLITRFSEFGLSTISIVNDEQFIGIITRTELMDVYGNSVLSQPGAIIEFQMPARNYTLSEITRLVESNDVKILHVLVVNLNSEDGSIAVILKFNTSDIRKLLAAFERYQYHISGVYNAISYDDDTQSRIKNLIKYLDF